MNILKIIIRDTIFVLKNFKKVFLFFKYKFVDFLKKNLNYKSLINLNNLRYFNEKFDFVLLSKNNCLFKLPSIEAKFFYNEFKDSKNKFDYENSTYDERNLFIIKHFIKNGDCVFDVGSHIGLYSIYLSKLVGSTGKVICLEPSDKTSQKLKSNFIINSCNNFKIYNCCADEENGYCDFFEVDYEKIPQGTVNSSTIMNEKISSKYFANKFIKIKKEKKSLDNIYRELINKNSSHPLNIKFIKIDTEGNEINVLKGAKEIIKEFNPIILFEFHTKRVKYLNQNLDFLKKEILKNYHVYKIFIDLKFSAVALNNFDFSNLDDYEGDLICLPKLSS
jgi:FkbM family methyltransferase